ncbi:MAG: DNA integrity scanning diadenylate cyclase DisA [Ornithinimicrobium sp.]
MTQRDEELMRATLAAAAPGTELRDGLERILRGRTGALIVLDDSPEVLDLCTGGFELQVPFSATRLRELAKMDGAIILDRDVTRIVRAATQLVPDPNIETRESGTRHRTAERTARQTSVPVVSASQSMSLVAVYVGDQRHVLDSSSQILSRADQALQTLERYRARLDEVAGTLSALEIENLVTVRDAAAMLQRLEMVRRISNEIAQYRVELGVDGRLIGLQLSELVGGIGLSRELVVRDYVHQAPTTRSENDILTSIDALTATDLLNLGAVARCLGFHGSTESLDTSVYPLGARLISRIPRLPPTIADRLIEHFGSLQALLAAGIDDLTAVEGVGEWRARVVREGLSRLAESSIMERYV